MKKVAIIGSGFSGLSAACHLAHNSFNVTVFEKNSTPGGRARKFENNGFTFDMGPSWYWMPDVFEKFFNHFGKKTTDYYQLKRLDPSYRIFFAKDDFVDIPAGTEAVAALFEKMEKGSGDALRRFVAEGKTKYEIGIKNLVYKPGLSLGELIDGEMLKHVFQLHVFTSISSYIRKFFKDPRIISILEFPVLFLGAQPEKTPALYSLMNYADIELGTWYPEGGMYKVIDAMTSLARDLGVTFRFDSPVDKLIMNGKAAKGLHAAGADFSSDYIIAGADYQHVEQDLLPADVRKYDNEYWNSRVLAPSSLIFYLGVSKKLKNLLHHTLFFDSDFALHAREIYENPSWPSQPQFYVSCPSRSDSSAAPEQCENLMILIPVAPGLDDTEAIREKYFNMVMDRLENITGETIRPFIVFRRSYAHKDFINDYNSFKGNAYGLANTLKQTANLKPSIINKKVPNLFYTGQLTVPGPGVPPSLISGYVVANQLMKQNKKSAAP